MEINSVNSEIKNLLQVSANEAQPPVEEQKQENSEELVYETVSNIIQDVGQPSPMSLFAAGSCLNSLSAVSNSLTDDEAKKIVELLKKYGVSPVVSAIHSGDYEAALFLIEHVRDNNNISYLLSLFIAAFNSRQNSLVKQQIDLIDKIIERNKYTPNDSVNFGVSQNWYYKKDTYHNLLSFAVHFGLTDLFDYLLEAGADINAQKGCVLTNAVESGDIEKIRFVLSKGARVDVPEYWFLQIPLEDKCDTEVIKLLLDYGTGFDKERMLSNATSRANLDVIKLMLERGANPEKVRNLLYLAVESGDCDTVKYYLDLGLKIKGDGVEGGNEFARAISKLDAKMVEFLIEHGVNPNGKNSSGEGSFLNYTLLLRTNNKEEEARKDEVLKVLIKHGALIS